METAISTTLVVLAFIVFILGILCAVNDDETWGIRLVVTAFIMFLAAWAVRVLWPLWAAAL